MSRTKRLWLHGIRIVAGIVLLTFTAVSACAETPAVIVAVTPATPENINPLMILQKFCEFLRAGQIDAAVDLLADDVVLTDSDDDAMVGKSAARAWLSRWDFDDMELCDIWIRGDQIAWTVRIYEGDAFDQASGWATLRHGKIVTLSFAD